MSGEEIRKIARKYHNPKDRINERWHPVYQDECKKIARKALEKRIMEKYVSRKINTETKRSTLHDG